MRRNAPFFGITSATRAEQQHRDQTHPAAHRMHHDRTGKILELLAKPCLEHALHTQIAVPNHALKNRVNQSDQQGGCDHLRQKFRPLGNPAGNNRRNRRRKREQEEKAHQFNAIILHHGLRTAEKMLAIGNAKANQKIRQGRHAKIHQDFHQRIHLIFTAHRTQLQKGKTGVHRQHHHRTDEQKHDVDAALQL